MTEISAVIFDVDGVLIDTEPVWREVETEVFATVGISLVPADGIQTMGLRIDEVVDLHYGRHPWPTPSREVIAQQILDGVIAHVRERGQPMAGVADAFAAARALGLPVALASSSPRPLIDAIVERLGLKDHLAAITTGDEVAKGKPDPEIYLLAASRLSLEPKQCLAVEDSINGVTAALTAGMICCAVPDPHSADDERIALAHYRLDSLLEFGDLLDGIAGPTPART